jgi:hypothetical protein
MFQVFSGEERPLWDLGDVTTGRPDGLVVKPPLTGAIFSRSPFGGRTFWKPLIGFVKFSRFQGSVTNLIRKKTFVDIN